MAQTIKPGVATGKTVQQIFKLAKAKNFALPAVNVIGSNTINAVLETAKEKTAEAAEWVEEKAHKLKESLQNTNDTVENKTEELTTKVEEQKSTE